MPRTPGQERGGGQRRERTPDYKALDRDLETIAAHLWGVFNFSLGSKDSPEAGRFANQIRLAYSQAERVKEGLGKTMSDREAAELVTSVVGAFEMDRDTREAVFGKKPKNLQRLEKQITNLREWAAAKLPSPTPVEENLEPVGEGPDELLEPAPESEDGEVPKNLMLSEMFNERPKEGAQNPEEMALREAKHAYLIREGQYFDTYQALRAFKAMPRQERIASEGKNMQVYQEYVRARETYIERARLSRGPKAAAALRAELVARDIAIAGGIEHNYMPTFLKNRVAEKPPASRRRMGTTFVLALSTLAVAATDVALIAATTTPPIEGQNPNQIWHARYGAPRREAAPTTNFIAIALAQAEEARRRGVPRPYVPSPIGSEGVTVVRTNATEQTPEETSQEVTAEQGDVVTNPDSAENLEGLTTNEGTGGPISLAPLEEPPTEP